MRADLGADAVLERRDDLAARRVVLGVGREHQRHVQVQPHRVSFDLDVSFLHDVEESHLNLAREIRQLVDGEDAAIRPRQESEVHRQLVGQEMPPTRRLDRIDVADDVGNGDIGRRELFHEPELARQPRDRRTVAVLRNDLAAVLGDRIERIVVDLAAGDDGNLLVEQRDQLAEDPAFRLTTQTQQDEVVA